MFELLEKLTTSEILAIIILLLVIIVAYFLGNISPAILIGKMHGVDIRKEGSGNPGATNVLRVLGKKAAFATLFIDIFKGVFAVLLGKLVSYYFLSPELAISYIMICGFMVFIGHIWPVIFGFKGGKGVATALGIALTIDWKIGLILAAVALFIIALTRRVAAGAVVGAISFPFIAYFINPAYTLWAIGMAIVVLVKHIENIKRLLKGEETKISFK